MANWKINCMEDHYPGLWHTWFREQIVAVALRHLSSGLFPMPPGSTRRSVSVIIVEFQNSSSYPRGSSAEHEVADGRSNQHLLGCTELS
jgi:hypothetical protein